MQIVNRDSGLPSHATKSRAMRHWFHEAAGIGGWTHRVAHQYIRAANVGEMLSRDPKRRPLEFGSRETIAAADGDAEIIARELTSALRAALTGARRAMFAGGRWKRICEIQTSSARYVLLRQPNPTAIGPQSLTESERRVVELAAYGLSPKESAHELGVSHSTVRVLLMRAARKYGVRSRAELMATLTILSPK
jgi:DNA-binding CsgD family transcriptional regulator